MKHTIIILIFSCFVTLIIGQNKLDINFESIKSTIENSDSEYYYPILLKRFNDFDSTLTRQEYALIYYGFSFQKDNPKNRPDVKKLKSWQDLQS